MMNWLFIASSALFFALGLIMIANPAWNRGWRRFNPAGVRLFGLFVAVIAAVNIYIKVRGF